MQINIASYRIKKNTIFIYNSSQYNMLDGKLLFQTHIEHHIEGFEDARIYNKIKFGLEKYFSI